MAGTAGTAGQILGQSATAHQVLHVPLSRSCQTRTRGFVCLVGGSRESEFRGRGFVWLRCAVVIFQNVWRPGWLARTAPWDGRRQWARRDSNLKSRCFMAAAHGSLFPFPSALGDCRSSLHLRLDRMPVPASLIARRAAATRTFPGFYQGRS